MSYTTVNLQNSLFFSANSGIPASAIGNGVKEYEDGKDEFGENTHPLELYITEL